ncbi:MAG TPA: CHAT domain-containing protein [Thermoanaerobaculia bacterium]|jgi:CHAT domain-containing protein|nr:CHAT domain-containing protein [Thermoanaerobaculia bacterium]
MAAVSRQLRQQAKAGSPSALGGLALTNLIAGNLDEAVSRLELATLQSPADGRLLSDLSAAYFARSERGGDAYGFVQALAAADRALAANGSLAEAQFNRALALRRLSLEGDARTAWWHVLTRDPGSPWASEARQELAALDQISDAEVWARQRARLERAVAEVDEGTQRDVASRYPQDCRVYVEDVLLPAWGRNVQARRQHLAARQLLAAQALASTMFARNHDRLLPDTVAAIGRSHASQLSRLVRGHLLYGRGRELHEQNRYASASALLRRAATELTAGGSPFASWARFYVAVASYHRPDYPTALQALTRQRSNPAISNYPALVAYVEWMLGLVEARLADPTSALSHYRAARALFVTAGEWENQAAIDNLIADEYERLGDRGLAWRSHYSALRLLPYLHKPRRVQDVFTNTINGLEESGDLEVALYFENEFIRQALRFGNPVGITMAYRMRGDLHARLRRLEPALADVRRAWQWSQRIPGEGLRQETQLELRIIEGRLLRTQEPDASLASLSQALSFVKEKKNRFAVIDILVERAATYRALTKLAAAASDLQAGIDELESRRVLLTEDSLRISYLDRSRSLFEEIVQLEVARGRGLDLALQYADQLKARALLDALGKPTPPFGMPALRRSGGAVSSASRIAAALPADAALVEYLSLEDRILCWIVRRQGVTLIPIDIPSLVLRRRVERFLGEIYRGGAPATSPAFAKELGFQLLAPLRSRLEGIKTLILVPDRELSALPFAALPWPGESSLLVEKYALAIAPSAEAYLSLKGNRRVRDHGRPSSAVLVGAIPFNHELFPQLEPLSHSDAEIRAIAALYPHSYLLAGHLATRRRFLAALLSADVVHFAGHALVDVTDPERSSLLLAPEAGMHDNGVLYARDIRLDAYPRTRLVVLASCGTAAGRLSRTEGVISLAHFFLAAGVPAIVASLWNVDDRTSAHFFYLFHRAFSTGASAAAALREAQIALLHESPSRTAGLAAWAGFQLIGTAD